MTPHGTRSRYINGRCRCDECTRSQREYQAKLKQRLRKREPEDWQHGRYSTYANWCCRCEPCTSAWAAYCRTARLRRKDAAA